MFCWCSVGALEVAESYGRVWHAHWPMANGAVITCRDEDTRGIEGRIEHAPFVPKVEPRASVLSRAGKEIARGRVRSSGIDVLPSTRCDLVVVCVVDRFFRISPGEIVTAHSAIATDQSNPSLLRSDGDVMNRKSKLMVEECLAGGNL